MSPNEYAAKWSEEYRRGTGLLKLVELIELDLISDEPPVPAEKGAAALRFFAEVLLPGKDRNEFRVLLQSRADELPPNMKEKPDIKSLRQDHDLLQSQLKLAQSNITDSTNQKARLEALESKRNVLASTIEKINNREIFE